MPYLVQGYQQSIECAPSYKVEIRAVPKATKRHSDKDVSCRGHRSGTISSQRNEEVITQPGRQRNMPAAPQFRYVARQKRKIKVKGYLKSEYTSRATSDVRVSGEIEIDLK